MTRSHRSEPRRGGSKPGLAPAACAHSATALRLGASFLRRTYDRNQGFCLRCGGGTAKFPLGKPGLTVTEQTVVDEATGWSLLMPLSATQPLMYHRWLRLLTVLEPGDQFVRYRGMHAFPFGSVSVSGLVVLRGDEAIGEFCTSCDEAAEEPAVADGTEIQPPDTGPEPVVAVWNDPRQLWLPLPI